MQKTFGKRMVRLLVGLLFFLLILLFCYCENNMITTSEFEVASDKLPEEFDGMVIDTSDGDIVESGNHEELLAQNGFYAELYNSQFEVA